MAKGNYAKVKDPTNPAHVNDFIAQFDKGSGALMVDYSEITPSEWIHTGSYLLNALYSGSLLRGIPNNKIVVVAGHPKTGKSYLLFNKLRELQKAGYFIYFFETENSPSKERLEAQGLDLTRVRIVQPETVGELTVASVQLTNEMMKAKARGEQMPKIAMAIDSITGLNSTKQLEDAIAGEMKADMGTVAKELKTFFNLMATRSGKVGMPILCTAHVYEAAEDQVPGSHGPKKSRITGGQGAMYMASIISKLRKRVDRDKDTKEKTGVVVTVDLEESRFSRPRTIQLYISFERGMNEFLGLQDLISWEACGIEKGKFVPLVDIAQDLMQRKVLTKEHILEGVTIDRDTIAKGMAKGKAEHLTQHLAWMVENGYMVEEPSGAGRGRSNEYRFTDKIQEGFSPDGSYFPIEDVVAVLNPLSPNYAVKHLGRVVEPQQLFTKEVFTRSVLEQLDENVVKPMFNFGTVSHTDPLEELMQHSTDAGVPKEPAEAE